MDGNEKQALDELAAMYPQLYLAPGEEGERLYPDVVQKGRQVPAKDLSHFHVLEEITYDMVETPAGEVLVITLGDRRDFETFVRIMAQRCRNADIPNTMGAVFLNGVINRKVPFMPKKDAMIILSTGPYSGVPAKEIGIPEEEWPAVSHTIRLYHECTHFVCYRLFPGERDAIRDELVADAVGITAALGHFDRVMAERFLGICDGRYQGGRLENYTSDPESRIPMIEETFTGIERTVKENVDLPPLELAIRLNELYG